MSCTDFFCFLPVWVSLCRLMTTPRRWSKCEPRSPKPCTSAIQPRQFYTGAPANAYLSGTQGLGVQGLGCLGVAGFRGVVGRSGQRDLPGDEASPLQKGFRVWV